MKIFNIIPSSQKELNRFFRENKDKSINYLRSRYSSLSEDDLKDIYQDSSIALFMNIHDGKLQNLTSSLFSYFLSICNNKALNTVRGIKKTIDIDESRNISNDMHDDIFQEQKISELEMLLNDNLQSTDNIRRLKQIEENEELVRQCVKNMPVPCNQILWGQYWDGLSHKTIAELYGMKNESVVKVQAMRCRNKFSEYLKNHNIKPWIR